MSRLNDVLKIMRTTDRMYETSAWDTFKSTLDLFLNAVKLEPARINEANQVLNGLLRRVYNEDFRTGRVNYQMIHDFLNPKRERFIQLLPGGQGGADLMRTIVTALTMAGGGARDNQWATEIVIAVTSRPPGPAAPQDGTVLVNRVTGE